MRRYDAVIVGAGHNGLVCAAYLARAGERVLVLEAGRVPGGLAADREFHPGFHAPVAHSLNHFSARVARDLNLEKFGFESPVRNLRTIGLDLDGQHLVLAGDELTGAADDEAAAVAGYHERMRRFAGALQPFWRTTMPPIGCAGLAGSLTFARIGFRLRRLGKSGMREFLRIASLPVRDLMDEHFRNDLLKSMLSWDGLAGSRLAPRSPNGAVLAMLYRMGEASRAKQAMPTRGIKPAAATPGDRRRKGNHAIPAGGVKGLIDSLCTAATAFGADIRCGAPVSRILVGENRGGGSDAEGKGSASGGLAANGVELADGERIEANRVVSATDPKRTFLDLVGARYLDIGFTNRIRRLRCDGLVAKLHLALNGVPEFEGLDRPGGRMIAAPTLDAIEFAFDAAKYGECPDDPVMEIVVPSLHEPSLAPAGCHVLSAQVMYVPYRLRGGWTDAARDQACAAAIDAIARYAPRIREQIVATEFLTPADIERECRVTGGHWHHAEFAIDQLLMMRPTYEAAQYRTPIPGLYLCGAGCHPGGDLTGVPGHNAAREMLR